MRASESSVLERVSPDGSAVNAAAAVCSNGGHCRELGADPAQLIDMLFVVDNSNSMASEQAALREQFPKLIRALTTGQTSDGKTFTPVRDLHLGVVSTDMGLAGISNNFPQCNTIRHIHGGDDGVLQHNSRGAPGCKSEYPPFLAFRQGEHDPEELAADFSCIANLGTTGCGFEQQLEAALKALTPKNPVDPTGKPIEPIQFLSTTPEGTFGHGDRPVSQGGNLGFLRNDPVTGRSLISVVLVSDEEDCSARDTGHFVSTNDPANPLSRQGINLRCFYNKQNLYAVERYVDGLRRLRPGREQHVLFSAIVGVPPDLVDATARDGVDFYDPSERDAYYDRMLADVRMTERFVSEDIPAIANVEPSCTRIDAAGVESKAYPPRRIVQVARGFGAQGLVQSICQDDFGPAMDNIIDLTASRLSQDCLDRPLVRESSGRVDCDVIWSLPAPGSTTRAPTRCSQLPFLSDLEEMPVHSGGGRNCKVEQLPVDEDDGAPDGKGWYYDDFSDETRSSCGGQEGGRIVPAGGTPPAGVRVFLDCHPGVMP